MQQIANTELDALQHLLKASWQFINQQALSDLPWYLVIGPSGSGKSHLINQAGLKLLPAKNLAIDPSDEDDSQHRLNCWFSRQAIFLDVPGNYLTHWHAFLTALLPYVKRKPLAGIILTMPLSDWWLQSKAEQKTQAQTLRETLHALTKQLKTPCPLYLALTKVDQIIGFNEFFADLGQEERGQAWGFNLTATSAHTASSLPRLFKIQFDQLLKRLHTRVVWRVHHERNLQKRALIQHFPLQMESLKNGLANLVYQLADVIALYNTTPMQGVYFISNLQQGMPIDCLHSALSETLALTPALTTRPTVPNKQQSYFAYQFFNHILFARAPVIKTKWRIEKHHKIRIGAYVSAVTLVVASGLLMANDFNKKVNNLNNAEAAIAEYKLLTQQLPVNTHDLNQTLPALNLIEQANAQVNLVSLPAFMAQAHALPGLTNETYHRALNKYFVPGIGNLLEQALNTSTDANFLYGGLKTYLMLGDPSHFNAAFVRSWLTNYWQQAFSNNPTLEKQLETHLDALLTQPVNPISLNPTLIAKVRSTLNNTSTPLLAYAIIKTQTSNTLTNPFVSTTKEATTFAQVFAANSLIISSLYTSEQFQTIYFQQIPKACTAALTGDYVLGENTNPNLTANTLNAAAGLADQVKLLYLRDYTHQWLTLLNNIQVIDWQNWQQATNSFNILLSSQSPLVRILQAVAANTSLQQLLPSTVNNITDQDIQAIKTNIVQPFADLNSLVANSPAQQSYDLDHALLQLGHLQNYLQHINGDNEKAFNAAKARFVGPITDNDPIRAILNTAKSAPEPVQNWLTAIANNSWHLVLTSTTEYLNATWKTQVLSVYNDYINNRYPLFPSASSDIELSEFTHFFGPGQVLDNYFQKHFAPFMDTSQAQWHWRSLDGQAPNFSPLLLTQLERAAIIRTMFFTDKQLNVQFSLQPIAMEEGVTSITLQINGQNLVDQPDAAGSHNITWPSDNKISAVSLSFTDNHGNQTSKTDDGPWALFKMLSKANLQPTNNTQNYLLTFDLNGNAARYQLLANKVINPFIPGIVDQFRCPESLD